VENFEFSSVSQLLTKNLERFPRKTYIFFNKERISYRKTCEEAVRVANALAANGAKQGDRAAILISNSPEFLYAYFGAALLGVITVPINTFLSGREVAVNLNDCEARFFITTEEFEKAVYIVKSEVRSLEHIFTFKDVEFTSINISHYSTVKDYTEPVITLDDLASLVYTSGTTGASKGVMLTHRNLIANAYGFKYKLNTTPEHRILTILPLFHAYTFMTCILGPLEGGCSIILLANVNDAKKKSFKRQLLFLRPTILLGVPQLFAAFARMETNFITKLLFPFRYCVSGGAPLAQEICNKFYSNFGIPLLEGYGLTEASPVVSFNPRYRSKAGTAGTPFLYVEVKVVDENDNTLPINTKGELCIRGETVMKGYWNKPEETAQALKNGWLHTADAAFIDEEGYIVIVDRIKDMIISKGMNVYPREIEDILYKYPGIQLAAVIGIKVKNDETAAAYITVDETYNEGGVKEYLKENLAAYKLPKQIIITDEIPLTSSGKIAKQTLKELVNKGKITGRLNL
jgi:long-chain acyl-CoA synthetase